MAHHCCPLKPLLVQLFHELFQRHQLISAVLVMLEYALVAKEFRIGSA